MRSAVEVRDMQGFLRLHTSIVDLGGARIVPAALGEHARPPRIPVGVPRVGLHRPALLPATEVTHHDWSKLHLIIVIERCYVTFERPVAGPLDS